jgi:hypothetical protein
MPSGAPRSFQRGSDWLLSDSDLAEFLAVHFALHPGPVVRRPEGKVSHEAKDAHTPSTASLHRRVSEADAGLLDGATLMRTIESPSGLNGSFVEVVYALPSGAFIRISEQDHGLPMALSSVTLLRAGSTVVDLPSGERVVTVQPVEDMTQVVLMYGDGHRVSIAAGSGPRTTPAEVQALHAGGPLDANVLLSLAQTISRVER